MKKKFLLACFFLITAVAAINYRWVSYLLHVASHQVRVIFQKERIADRLRHPDMPAQERQMLEATQKIRSFVEKQYGLTASVSYRSFFHTGRPYLGYNITVVPEFSLTPHAFSFWPIGSFDYLGFFSKEKAEAWAREYRNKNFDVHLSEIGGYSTLGWFEDPLYSTQLSWGEFGLARLLAHEIAHERLYYRNDTTSSELIAAFIERKAALDYLRSEGKKVPDERQLSEYRNRAAEFSAEIDRARQQLEALYASKTGTEAMRSQKRQILRMLHRTLSKKKSAYATLPAAKELPAPDELNNAWLVQFHRYSPQSAAMEATFQACRKKNSAEAYRCWFSEMATLKACTPEKRKEWFKGNQAPAEYCRT